jgi:hypothetical protein
LSKPLLVPFQHTFVPVVRPIYENEFFPVFLRPLAKEEDFYGERPAKNMKRVSRFKSNFVKRDKMQLPCPLKSSIPPCNDAVKMLSQSSKIVFVLFPSGSCLKLFLLFLMVPPLSRRPMICTPPASMYQQKELRFHVDPFVTHSQRVPWECTLQRHFTMMAIPVSYRRCGKVLWVTIT